MAFMSSLVTNLVISVHGKKGTKQTGIMDFMPKWDGLGDEKEVKKQSTEDMKKALMEIATAQNKKEARKNTNINKPPTNYKKEK